jgi:hypothetical protein
MKRDERGYMHNENLNNAPVEGAKLAWSRPELRRLDAGAAEANTAISGRTDGIGQQES